MVKIRGVVWLNKPAENRDNGKDIVNLVHLEFGNELAWRGTTLALPFSSQSRQGMRESLCQHPTPSTEIRR